MRRLLVLVMICIVPAVIDAPPALAAGTWTWPVLGPVIHGFDPPDSPYGSGHRGIDIAAPIGTPVRSAAPGIVSFAGPVGGRLFVSVDHGGGVVSSYSFLSAIGVRKGDTVAQGASLGRSGEGHLGVTPTHLHLGVRVDGAYVDPLDYLAPPDVVTMIRLAPLAG